MALNVCEDNETKQFTRMYVCLVIYFAVQVVKWRDIIRARLVLVIFDSSSNVKKKKKKKKKFPSLKQSKLTIEVSFQSTYGF
jgi:hypothetical protein